MAKTAKPLPELDWLTPRLQLCRLISLVCFFAIVALLLVWNLLFADLHGASPWVILIPIIPLAILAPGLLNGSARGHAWCCFVVNLYFIQGVLAATDPNRVVYGWLLASLSFVLFCSALYYTRWRFQYDRKLAGEA